MTPQDLNKKLPPDFYNHSTLVVAERLLGALLVRRTGPRLMAGRIVETEAYIGETDPACHAFRGLTPRTRIMYGAPGYAYVYFTYGMHYMLNVVTEKQGFPAAVLIRALEPVKGFSGDDPRPASGPAKLCKAMSIDKQLNGESLSGDRLWLAMDPQPPALTIRWSPRIGISSGQDRIWRAYVYGNPFVSRRSNPAHALEPSGI